MSNGTTRRAVLKSGLLSSLLALFQKPVATSAHQIEKYSGSCGVLVDLTRCVGCRSCEAACNAENRLPPPQVPFTELSVYEKKPNQHRRRTDETRYTVVNRFEIPGREHPLFKKVQCNHCQEPACLTSCFVNAYTKTPEGAVVYNPEVCVGCRTCMVACPFYIPAFKYSSSFKPQIMKCMFCYETRLQHGKIPACVEACPRDALVFGLREELLQRGRRRIANNPDMYQDHIYGEFEVGGTSWLYLSDIPFDIAGFDTEITHEPILNSVTGFLGLVPMVLTIWPALFTGFHLLSSRKDRQKNEDDTPVTDNSQDEREGK